MDRRATSSICLLAEVSEIKSYLPLVRQLRQKGLERRHFQEMSKALGTDIDPTRLTLRDIKRRKLARAETLEAIKNVAGVASKENAIKVSIDGVEASIRETSFETIPYKETSTKVIKSGESVITTLEELLIKLQALKGSDTPSSRPRGSASTRVSSSTC